MTITNDELREIEARTNAATPGPWKATPHGSNVFVLWDGDKVRLNGRICTVDDVVQSSFTDAEFVAHARTDVPALLSEVRRLREDLAEYQQRERLACGHG